MNLFKREFFKKEVFGSAAGEWLLSVLLFDYAVLIFWEYFVRGMVTEILNPHWLLGAMLFLVLWLAEKGVDRKEKAALLFQKFKFLFFLLLFSFTAMIFLDWWAVGLPEGIFFSGLSLAGLFWLSRQLSQKEE